MNAYDFDKTIYDGDSTADFYKYTFLKFGKTRKYLFVTAGAFALYLLGVWTKTRFKEKMYSFLKGIPDIDKALEMFWDGHEKNIKAYYLENQKDDDVIISASPEFLLEPICKRLGIKHLIASRVDKHTGKYTGENCYGEEKVKRLDEYMSDYRMEEFYSDSVSDDPLGRLAEKSYIVKGERLIPRNEYTLPLSHRIKHMFSELPAFTVIGAVNTLSCVVLSYIISLFAAPQTAFNAGYALSLLLGYALNSKITFKTKPGILKLIKYALSYVPNFLVQKAVMIVAYDVLHLNKLLCFVLAAVIALPVTFLAVKIFAFGKKGRK